MNNELKKEKLNAMIEKGFENRNINKSYYRQVLIREELKRFEQNKMLDNLLFGADLVSWAKDNDIYMGYGRGSMCCSFVCYLLKLTEVYPYNNRFIFERIHGDKPFCLELENGKTQKIVDYLISTYGKDNVVVTTGQKTEIRIAVKESENNYAIDACIELIENNLLGKIHDCFTLVNVLYPDHELMVSKDCQEKRTFDLINSLDIEGVFQPAGGEQKFLEKIKAIKPQNIEDLAMLIVYHSREDKYNVFYDANNDKEFGKYLLSYLSNTQGKLIYQEQLTRIFTEELKISRSDAEMFRQDVFAVAKKQDVKYKNMFIEKVTSKYGKKIAYLLCEKLWYYGKKTFLKAYAFSLAQQYYDIAFLKANYRDEFNNVFLGIETQIRYERVLRDELAYDILRGENKIGETLVEIFGYGNNILLECGKALFPDPSTKYIENYVQNKEYDAIIITHAHEDHCGLLDKPVAANSIYMGEATLSILLEKGMIATQNINKVKLMHSEEEFYIGAIGFKPHLCDHSVVDSYMIEVFDGVQTILYTGDFRSNGRKSFKSLLNRLPNNVDVLISENTIDIDKNDTEWDLEKEAVKIMKNHKEVFILQSSLNLDRIVSFYRACKKTNTNFLMTPLNSKIARLVEHIPNPKEYDNCYLYLPKKVDEKTHMELKLEYGKKLIGRNDIAKIDKFAMLISTGMVEYLKKLSKERDLSKSVLIYSMWNGYKEGQAEALSLLRKIGMKIVDLHVSGHADKEAKDKLIARTKPDKVIYVHTQD